MNLEIINIDNQELHLYFATNNDKDVQFQQERLENTFIIL